MVAFGRMACVLAAAAFAVGGCGSDEKEDYLADVDEICKEADEKVAELDQPDTDNVRQAVPVLRQGQQIVRDSLEEARRVEKPDDQDFSRDVDAYFDQVEQSIDANERAVAAARKGDEAALGREFQAAADRNKELERVAAELGFKECSKSD